MDKSVNIFVSDSKSPHLLLVEVTINSGLETDLKECGVLHMTRAQYPVFKSIIMNGALGNPIQCTIIDNRGETL